MVFDASTLILLAKIDLLELFIDDFRGRIIIPERVGLEARSGGSEEIPLIERLIKDKKIIVSRVKNRRHIDKLREDFHIDWGEAEAIGLAMQDGINIIATDDRNAIRACKMLKIDFVTAITILLRAFEKKLIDKDDAIIKLEKLQLIGRYSKRIIKDSERQLKGGI